mgnify:CR=1 FL=1
MSEVHDWVWFTSAKGTVGIVKMETIEPMIANKAAFKAARVREARDHSDSVVACSEDIPDRAAAESLKGARIFVPRSSFPTPEEGEYYWVDLIGLQVVNREGVVLGEVRELMATGPQTVLVLQAEEAGKKVERMIPFVSAFVDKVDTAARCITVDWQADY